MQYAHSHPGAAASAVHAQALVMGPPKGMTAMAAAPMPGQQQQQHPQQQQQQQAPVGVQPPPPQWMPGQGLLPDSAARDSMLRPPAA
jgi:hypothetical protein